MTNEEFMQYFGFDKNNNPMEYNPHSFIYYSSLNDLRKWQDNFNSWYWNDTLEFIESL